MTVLTGAIYAPDDSGLIRLYGGPLVYTTAGVEHRIDGDVVLRLGPTCAVNVWVAGDADRIEDMFNGPDLNFAVPSGQALQPPTGWMMENFTGRHPWMEQNVPVNRLLAGDITAATTFVLHIAGFHTPFAARHFGLPQVRPDPATQFDLPGWSLRLIRVDQSLGFSFVIEAVPHAPVDVRVLSRLRSRLAVLLGFLSGSAVGVGPVAGLNAGREVVFAQLVAPRYQAVESGVRWYPSTDLPAALKAVAEGMTLIATDSTLDMLITRAIQHLLEANGRDVVVEVRLPTACAGLELLAWGILQQQGWTTPEAINKLTAAARARLLMRSINQPTDIPPGATALRVRAKSMQLAGGPEVVYNVRNKVIHPPDKLGRLEWPSGDELVQALMLAGTYLELAILHFLGYTGSYEPRPHMGRGNRSLGFG